MFDLTQLYDAIMPAQRRITLVKISEFWYYTKSLRVLLFWDSQIETDRIHRWRTEGGSPWQERSLCGMILMLLDCGGWLKRAKVALKPGGYCRWPQSTTVPRELRLPRSAGSVFQIIRDWVLRFNARGADGLLDGKAPGRPSKLNDAQRQAVARMIESGPIPAVHGVVRWRLIDLAQWIFEEFRITIAKQTLSRELRAMGYRKLSARPRHHAQPAGAIEDFKKASFRAWMPSHARRRLLATK